MQHQADMGRAQTDSRIPGQGEIGIFNAIKPVVGIIVHYCGESFRYRILPNCIDYPGLYSFIHFINDHQVSTTHPLNIKEDKWSALFSPNLLPSRYICHESRHT